MSKLTQLAFDEPAIGDRIEELDEAGLDGLEFGVIGFDNETIVRRYNAFESKCAGLRASVVVGYPLFTVVAPCLNNYLVAQRFADAAAAGTGLDATIDYVLTLRMRPVKVSLRLVAPAGPGLRHVLVARRPR